MKPRLIESKREYYELARQGLVGNSPKTWASVDEFLRNCYDRTVGIRLVTPGDRRFTPYAERRQLRRKVSLLKLKEGEYYLTENVKPEEVRLAGELGWHNGQWVFFHSRMKTHMRRALKEDGHYLYGFNALFYIKAHCAGNEWDDLLDLYDAYSPGGRYPVIELTFTTQPHGINDQRLLIWEVRHY